jgi:hypothetical protein
MARTGPSAADLQLIGQLGARDLSVSTAQLERWRHAGLLPRNSRRGCGRGQGSVSEASPEAVEIAAALSRHTRQGRDLRLAIIDWFADAGTPPMSGEMAVPEPPYAAVRSALMWLLATDRAYQLFQQARSARTEAELDNFYAAADAVLPRSMSPAASFDPAVIREALLTGRDAPDGTVKSGQQVRSAIIQLIAAVGTGYGEVTADLLAKAMADIGLVPQMSEADGQRVLARMALLNELPTGAVRSMAELLLARYDPLEMLSLANAELLQRARTATLSLARAGWTYLFHALLMPDTLGLAALRATIDDLGIGPWLLQTFRNLLSTDETNVFSTYGFASTVVSCLHPFTMAIGQLLHDQMASGPPLVPDNVHDAEKFVADWMSTLTDTARQRHRDGASGG